jgi:hypothetical protein
VRVGARTLVLLAFCAAAAAAALAHVAIDIIGDYALPADTYDHLAHGSRELVSGLALGLAAILAAHGLRICCDIATFNRTRILAVTRPIHEAFYTVAVAVSAAVVVVPAMEWLDGRFAGVPVRELDDAFGGSLLLGLGTTIACATVVALVIYGIANWLISHRDSIVVIIATLLRRLSGVARPSSYDLDAQLFKPRRRRATSALLLAKRGPPELLLT